MTDADKCLDPCPFPLGAIQPCQRPGGHDGKHGNGSVTWLGPCSVCGSREGVRRFAVTVDGQELLLTALLCSQHGDAYLLNAGRALGELLAAKEG